MQLTITTPTELYLILRYDPIAQSITGNFSTDDPTQLTPQQQEAIKLVSEQISTYIAPFLYLGVNKTTLKQISYEISNLLWKIHQQTGVEIMLDDTGFVQDKYSYRYDGTHIF